MGKLYLNKTFFFFNATSLPIGADQSFSTLLKKQRSFWKAPNWRVAELTGFWANPASHSSSYVTVLWYATKSSPLILKLLRVQMILSFISANQTKTAKL